MSWHLKKCLSMPSWEEALLILASISVSLVSSGVRMAPRYLKGVVKWMLCLPSFRRMSGMSDEV